MLSNPALIPDWLREFGADAAAVTFSVILVVAYYVVHRARVRQDPAYSVHFVNELTRRIWVDHVMSNPDRGLMGVQTLRNFIMYPILMVSTAALLLIGTLTLTQHAETIMRSWHVLNFVGSHSAELWIIKVMCLLAAFLVAFFAFAMAIRLANHVLFMINVPKEFQEAHSEVLASQHVARRLNEAGYMLAVGVRAFFFAIPLVFWLFGPVFLLLATAGVIGLLSWLDRSRSGL